MSAFALPLWLSLSTLPATAAGRAFRGVAGRPGGASRLAHSVAGLVTAVGAMCLAAVVGRAVAPVLGGPADDYGLAAALLVVAAGGIGLQTLRSPQPAAAVPASVSAVVLAVLAASWPVICVFAAIGLVERRAYVLALGLVAGCASAMVPAFLRLRPRSAVPIEGAAMPVLAIGSLILGAALFMGVASDLDPPPPWPAGLHEVLGQLFDDQGQWVCAKSC